MEGVPTYLSAEKYAEYSGLGVQEVKRLCNIGDIKCSRTETGRYKIPVYKNGITKEMYDEILKENARLKGIIQSVNLATQI